MDELTQRCRDAFLRIPHGDRVRSAFSFLRACAINAQVPGATYWRLDYAGPAYVYQFRIIDTGTMTDPDDEEVPDGATVYTLRAAGLAEMLNTMAKMLRGLVEIQRLGHSIDLMCARRRATAHYRD